MLIDDLKDIVQNFPLLDKESSETIGTSAPKKITLNVIKFIPNLFGYKVRQPKTMLQAIHELYSNITSIYAEKQDLSAKHMAKLLFIFTEYQDEQTGGFLSDKLITLLDDYYQVSTVWLGNILKRHQIDYHNLSLSPMVVSILQEKLLTKINPEPLLPEKLFSQRNIENLCSFSENFCLDIFSNFRYPLNETTFNLFLKLKFKLDNPQQKKLVNYFSLVIDILAEQDLLNPDLVLNIYQKHSLPLLECIIKYRKVCSDGLLDYLFKNSAAPYNFQLMDWIVKLLAACENNSRTKSFTGWAEYLSKTYFDFLGVTGAVAAFTTLQSERNGIDYIQNECGLFIQTILTYQQRFNVINDFLTSNQCLGKSWSQIQPLLLDHIKNNMPLVYCDPENIQQQTSLKNLLICAENFYALQQDLSATKVSQNNFLALKNTVNTLDINQPVTSTAFCNKA